MSQVGFNVIFFLEMSTKCDLYKAAKNAAISLEIVF